MRPARGLPASTVTDGLLDAADTPRATSRRAAWKELIAGRPRLVSAKGSESLITDTFTAVLNCCRSRSMASPVAVWKRCAALVVLSRFAPSA